MLQQETIRRLFLTDFKIDGTYFFDRLPRNFLLKEELPSAVRHVCDAIVLIRVRDAQGIIGFGTGLVLGRAVLTALHVVKDAESISLTHGQCEIGAREIARNKNSDFALLEPEKLLLAPSVVLAGKWQAGYGELYVVGHLFLREAREGETSTYRKLPCAYKIKGTARREARRGRFAVAVPSAVENFFRGFSGGVLVDSYGVIVGMTQATAKMPKWILGGGGGILLRYSAYIVGARGYKMRDFLKKVISND
ncbi:MAG: serine protease [Candidatus Spechtbacterales bacterium]